MPRLTPAEIANVTQLRATVLSQLAQTIKDLGEAEGFTYIPISETSEEGIVFRQTLREAKEACQARAAKIKTDQRAMIDLHMTPVTTLTRDRMADVLASGDEVHMGGFVQALVTTYSKAAPDNREALTLGFEWLPELHAKWAAR